MPKNQFTLNDYHLDAVNERLLVLLNVLQYDSEEAKHFKRGERICINQQRADLLTFKRYLFKEAEHHEVRFYILPDSIEQKIHFINAIINLKNWQPKAQED